MAPTALLPSSRRPRVLSLATGAWAPAAAQPLLVLSGALLRQVSVAGVRAAEVVAADDVVPARTSEDGLPTLPCEIGWTVLAPARVAVLDERAGSVELRAELVAVRTTRRLNRLAVQLAIMRDPRVDRRLLLMLWHLADRWGRVTRDGVLVPLPLSHRVLADLVGAQRPTVTQAAGALERAGELQRVPAGGWCLCRGRVSL